MFNLFNMDELLNNMISELEQTSIMTYNTSWRIVFNQIKAGFSVKSMYLLYYGVSHWQNEHIYAELLCSKFDILYV